MIIYFFTKGGRNVASSRQRAFLMAEKLNQMGIEAIVQQPYQLSISETSWPQKAKLIWQYVSALGRSKKGDALYFQRTIYNKYFLIVTVLYKLFFWNRKMIFDFDDAIYLNLFYKTKLLTKLADAVIVGSHALADWAKKYNSKVFLIPTCTSFAVNSKLNRFQKNINQKKQFTIGWVGDGPAHYQNLVILKPIFEELIRRSIDFRFILVGARGNPKIYSLFNKIKGLNVKFIEWSDPEATLKIIRQFDAGLMPLIDNEWNRGKCALKAIEYMACGTPAVVSPVGENRYLIKDGWNGFLAGSASEWVAKLIELSTNSRLARRITERARETVVKEYSFESNAPKLMDIINKL